MSVDLRNRPFSLLGGVSLVVLMAAFAVAPTLARAADAPAADDDDIQEIVVTGQRFAVKDATRRKAEATQILDSISADDAGKLPDNSVTEVLQRIPGVTITHFAAVGDPDHYSVEGSGVTVRGMSQVGSMLNGREAFSANGGRTLQFEDIPPELLAGLDTYKSQSADLIEGGIGGTVNLRTKLPFDFKEETFSGSITANYGDFIGQTRPGGSLLYANRWQTGIGEMGIVLDSAYSDISTRHDTIQVEPYFPQVVGGQNVQVPGGFDWRSGTFDRKRLGNYEAFEWAPNNDVTFTQVAFRSDYWSTSREAGIYNTLNTTIVPAAGSSATFGPGGGLTSASQLVGSSWDPLQPAGQTGGSLASVNPGQTIQHNVTTDLSEGLKWTPTSRLTFKTDFQYALAQSQQQRIDLFGDVSIPSYGLNLTGGLPVVTVANPGGLANASNYLWLATMDHIEQHYGREFAWSGDADYKVSDTGFLRGIQVGARFADRTEKDSVSTYNWQALTPPWDSTDQWKTFNTANPGDVTYSGFSNFFRGATSLPASVYFPSWSLLKNYPDSIAYLHKTYGVAGDTTQPIAFSPSDVARSRTRTETFFATARFGDDDVFGMKVSGNAGVRVINIENSSAGYIQQPTGQVLFNGVVGDLPGGYSANAGGHNSLMALPSFNMQIQPTEDVHLRFAAYQAVSLPSFTNMNAAGSISLTTDSGSKSIIGASSYVGNPNLKPQLANNLDVSLEWYMPDGSQAHVAGFYKQIKDYISYGVTTQNLAITMPGGVTQVMPVAVSNYFNSSPAYVKGLEVGVQKFFTFLPDPFDGLGIDANFTYINSRSPGDLSYDMNGNRISGLPVDLLSKYSYNVAGMYEKGPVSLRLAYTWRSKYLLTPTANGTNGTYTNADGKTITYNLPIFADDYGTLDGSVSYNIDDHITFSVQAQNLTNSVTKTLMGFGDQQYGRSWFVADRRYTGVLRFSY